MAAELVRRQVARRSLFVAVVSLNGVVASLVMEWMVWVTGLREPRPLLEYRGGAGVVFANADPPAEGCYYCGLWKT